MGDLILQRLGWARWTALALLVFALLRMASVVFAEPIVGFANQYDMHRSSACLGLWPDDVPAAQATPEAPRALYRLQAPRDPECYPSTQVAVAWLAIQFDDVLDRVRGGDHERMSLRVVGLIGVLLWLFGAICVSRMFWHSPSLLLGHGVISAAFIADPFNTLYLNTLYTEFPALLGAYFGTAILVSLWSKAERPGWRLMGLLLCLLMLGLSRVQHLALPVLMSLFAVLALWRSGASWRRSALALSSACLLIVVIQGSQQSRFEVIARANIADTVLGAAMPAGDPEAIATALDLPAHCADHAYSTWYRQHGEDVFAQCPELAAVSRLKLLWVSLRNPEVFARMMLRGVLMSQNFRLGYLGERGGSDYTSIAVDGNPLWFSIATPINALPPQGFLLLAVALLMAIPLFWFALWRGRRGRCADMGVDSVLIAVCMHVFALTALSSVFGDGYSEVARHLHLGFNALLVAVLMLPLWILRRWRRPTGVNGALTMIAPLSIAILWLLICLWAIRLPLAFGVLGTPAGLLPSSGPIELRGWALDTRPLRRVTAAVDGRELLSLQRTLHPRLDAVFPYIEGAARSGFVGTFDAAQLRGARFLEIIAIDAEGRRVLIERRAIR